jgi:hypothetical protein
MKTIVQKIALLFCMMATPLAALVNYDGPQREVNGILLLPDANDPKAYYYLPPAPHVSMRQDGLPELMAVKFVDPDSKASGGLFHMLVTLALPEEERAALEQGLKGLVPKAKLLGPVPLLQEEGSFTIVSATLKDGGFTRSLISSGKAPVTPGSKAAVAASLSPQGATLLWDSLIRPTSDVSVAVSAWYEAMIPAYKARIRADVSTVYTHFSTIQNRQEAYTKTQLRDIFDELVRKGTVDVEVLDRLPEDENNKAMQTLTDLAANKLTEIIFDTKTGFTALPEKETAVEKGQIKGRQKRGAFARFFKGTGNQKYVTDNQYVLKKREDINRAEFSINLTRNAVVKVPFDTAGNISGFYERYKANPDIFRVVNLADPAFQKRELFFRIDGDFAEAFEKIMNFASVSLRKRYQGQPESTGELIFTREDIRDGRFSKSWNYARLGAKDAGWLEYDYRLTWSLKGNAKVHLPAGADGWISSSEPIVTIAPPLERLDLQVDADRIMFDELGYRSAMVQARYTRFGKRKTEKLAILKNSDAESLNEAVLFSDPKSGVEYKVDWYPFRGKAVKGTWQPLESEYLVLTPPALGE